MERRLALGERLTLLPWLALTHVHNRGIAFSLLEAVSWILPAGIALTLLFMLFYNKARWMRAPLAPWAIALLAGGAIGNLLDRLRVGAVIDYVELSVWPVFNLADVAVTLGAGLLLLTLLRPDGTLARGDS